MKNKTPPSETSKLPLWYKTAESIGIPTTTALIGAPVGTALRQYQNNSQLGTKGAILAFNGIGTITPFLIIRNILRVGAVPTVKEFAGKNHPDALSKETAQNLATVATTILGDVINTPMELMAAKQQTWNEQSGKPKPSFTKYFKESASTPEFVKKLYGIEGNLRGGATAAVGLRTAPFLAILILANHEINKRMEPTNFNQKMAATILTGAVGMLAEAMLTPLSAIQQQTMKFEKPETLLGASRKVLGGGFNNAYKGVLSRGMIGGFASTITLGALAGQKALAEHHGRG